MKKFFVSAATVVLCFFISCKDSGESTSGSSNANNEKNKANSREIYRAIETGDVSKLDSIIDKDIVDHGDMGDMHGIDTVKKMFIQYHKQVKDLKMEPIAESTDGDYHFSYFHFTGTANDASMGVPAGTKMDMTGVDLMKMKGGKAVEHWGFSQGKDMIKMLNMDPNMKPCMDKMMEMYNKKNSASGSSPKDSATL